ncbi:MAG: PRC-barrel domain protein [Myxococcaceae bacterium]|nr:PRC-barrel domain protein [Myxococcaceae bacterium]
MNRKFVIASATVLAMFAGLALAEDKPSGMKKDDEMGKVPEKEAGKEIKEAKAKLGVSKSEMETIATGWSARKELMNKGVANDQKDRIGTIEDVIITPEEGKPYAVIGVGGFLGIDRHDVVIPINQLKMKDGSLMLPGATKDALKALPKFEYPQKRASR